jgi:hypothetical protein
MKDAGMRIRVEPELRDRFINLCRDNDVPAAQVLRSFMRELVQDKTIAPNSITRLAKTSRKTFTKN